jgi:amino acid adenylation domain-containing protein
MKGSSDSRSSPRRDDLSLQQKFEASNLTARQFRLWLELSVNPNLPRHQFFRAVELPSELAPHLDVAWSYFAHAADSTRARLVETEGVPRLVFGTEFQPLQRATLAPAATDGDAVSAWAFPHWPIFQSGDLLFRQALLTTHDGRYIWALTASHLVCDGRSNDILFSTIASTLRRLALGEALTPLELPSFEVNMATERNQERDKRLQEKNEHWTAWSEERQAPLFSVFGMTRDKSSNERFRVPSAIPRKVVDQLFEQCSTPGLLHRSVEVTVANFLTAFVATWIWRHGGNQELIVGVPFHGRAAGEERLIGFKSEILPVRLDLDPEVTFVDLVQQVHERTKESLQRRGTSIANPFSAPLYQVSQNFTYQQKQFANPQLALKRVEIQRPSTAPELVTALQSNSTDEPGVMRFILSLNPRLIELSDPERVGAGYLNALQNLVENPMQTLRRISFVDAKSLAFFDQQAKISSSLTQDCPHATYADWLSRWSLRASRATSTVAIRHGDVSMTHAELHRQARAWAGLLTSSGVQPGDRILAWTPSCNELAAAWIALMSTGAVYVPVHADTPAGQVMALASELGSTLILASPEHAAELEGSGRTIIALAVDSLQFVEPMDLHEPDPESIAHIFHTSGSTGRAKPIAVSHRALTASIQSWIEANKMQPGEVIYHFYAITFDPWLTGLIPALWLDGSCVISDQGQPVSGRELLEHLQRYRVSTLCTPTAYFHALCDLRLPPHVNRWIVGGEALAADKAMRFLQPQGSPHTTRLINAYGPTETTIWASILDVTPDHADRVPLGRPLPTCSFRVCDAWGNYTPFGVPGELWIGGQQLANGYFNQSELTQDRFVELPLEGNQGPGTRWYKTGDLVRWRKDGDLDFLGRIDRQVQIRGHRIEPAEIEIALRQLDGVKDALVVPVSLNTTTTLCAWLIPTVSNTMLDPVRLRADLLRSLPEYKVPKWLLTIDEFPRSPNGKIDPARLPDVDLAQNQNVTDRLPTLTLWDLRLTFEEVLHLPRVGIDDDFFALGGDSLLLVALLATIERRFGKTLEATQVIQHPTIGGLARFLESDRSAPASLVVEMKPGTQSPLFCIPGAGGIGVEFYPLSRRLPADQPVIVLRSSGTDGHAHPPATAHDLIEEHVRQIIDYREQHNERRPVHLMGYSLGGIFAWEVAQRLHARRIDIGEIFLIDSHVATKAGRALFKKPGRGLLARVRAGFQKPNTEERRALAEQLDAAIQSGVIMEASALGRYNLLVQAGFFRDIESRPAEFPTTFLLASRGPRHKHAELWKLLAPNLAIRVIDGEHEGNLSIVREPAVGPLAEVVSAVLGKD